MNETFQVTAIGHVEAGRTDPIDDDWDAVPASIVLDERFDEEALMGLDAFSHVEVIYLFHQVPDEEVEGKARHPRGNKDWPRVGIFAQRGKGRPNRLGATIARVDRVEGRVLHITGLDAIDGTPVLDLKPVMKGFLPRTSVTEPSWASEIMASYW
ncbi:MAG: SAM-dependent methyltransferase [Candidatus Phaeomarinobacter sp.]